MTKHTSSKSTNNKDARYVLYTKLFWCVVLVFCYSFCQAQSKEPVLKDTLNTDTVVAQKDLIDVLKKWFGKKKDSLESNIKKPGVYYFVFIPSIGYAQQTGFSLWSSINCSFYNDSVHKQNISVIYGSVEYAQKGQLSTFLSSNIWTKGNKLNLLSDVRYELYSQETYGLGGQSNLADADRIYYNYFRFYQLFQKKIAHDFLAGAGYSIDYYFKINDQNANKHQLSTLYNQYDSSKRNVASGLVVNILYDARRNANNPVNSNYANIIYKQCTKSLGSDNNWQSLYLDFRKYIKFPANSKNLLAFWNFNWFTFGSKPPYFTLPGTGGDTYANSGRQYIAGRFRSKNMLYLESEYRFTVTRNGLWGGVVFANVQSVTNMNTSQFDNLKGGYGAGFRLKLNKKSNINLIVTYGFGAAGAKGLFFNLGEVF
ncbi:MAG: hypothetical protein SGJ10_09635 [Bacteroidota bacterium]|nr:hypothetical protein [Bacteroidota bacterium]